MPAIHYQNNHVPYKRVPYAVGDTVLDSLLNVGIKIPNSCRSGVCQSCLMKVLRGSIPKEAQKGLRESHLRKGYFMACICKPEEDIAVAEVDDALCHEVELDRVQTLTETVFQVLFRPLVQFPYSAGQFVSLQRSDGLARSFSLASLPSEDRLVMHIRRVPNGRMSGWLFEQAQQGERLMVRGPFGDCFYIPGTPEQRLLLVATGTGLAPLYGLARDALGQGHTGRIDLYHGGRTRADLYHFRELTELQRRHGNFHYHPVLREGDTCPAGCRTGTLENVVMTDHPNPSSLRTYLCGNPDMVKSIQKKLFLAGQSLHSIHSDAFLPSANENADRAVGEKDG